MSYQRINYTTTDGKPSSAYWEPLTGDAWDVYTRAPVMVVESSGAFTEWCPPVQARTLASRELGQDRNPVSVIVKPYIRAWMIAPVALFALAMFWISETFLK